MSPSHSSKIAAFVSLAVGLAIPLRISGVAVEQGILGLALIACLVLLKDDTEARRKIRRVLASTSGRLVTLIFIVWACLVPFSRDPWGSLEIGGRSGLMLLAAVVVWGILSVHDERRGLLLKTFMVAALVCGFVGVVALLGGEWPLRILMVRFHAHLDPDMALKAYAAASMCMIPVVIYAGRLLKGRWQYWAYAYVPLSITIMVMSHNRAAVAGLLAMIVVLFALYAIIRHAMVKQLFFGTLIASIGAIAYIRREQVNYLEASFDGAYLPAWLIDPHRQVIWKFTFEKFLDKPWFGNGIDQLNKLSGAEDIIIVMGLKMQLMPSHPHNWFLEILAETGVVGMFPMLVAICVITWSLGKSFLKERNERALALLMLFVCFWTNSLFSFSIWAVWWQLCLYILFAIVASCSQTLSRDSAFLK